MKAEIRPFNFEELLQHVLEGAVSKLDPTVRRLIERYFRLAYIMGGGCALSILSEADSKLEALERIIKEIESAQNKEVKVFGHVSKASGLTEDDDNLLETVFGRYKSRPRESDPNLN